MILPEKFIGRMKLILGGEFDQFIDSLRRESRASIRINPAKYRETPSLEGVDYCSSGYFLNSRPLFTIDPFFHSGVYYVQEASSMILEQAVKQLFPAYPLKVLDLCASPGGKSTHLASLLPRGTLLVSNDVIRQRAMVLSENLKKWGSANIVVTNNDPKDMARLEGFFDVLVIDAPCSGEGLFRRDPTAVAEWSEENVRLCSQRQKRILADAWPALKNGGILIYSTCTYNQAENEENIHWLRNNMEDVEPLELRIAKSWGLVQTEAGGIPCYRFYPHKVMGEGFFISIIRKTSGRDGFSGKTDKKNLLSASKAEKTTGSRLLIDGEEEILRHEDSLLAFPGSLLSDLQLIRHYLRIVHAGIRIGQLADSKIIPAHELALSQVVNRDAFPETKVSLEEALNFLKREEIHPASDEKGWNLLSYRTVPLGWVKNIGNRFNSAFPKEWRIRMDISEYMGKRLVDEADKFPV